MSGHHSKKRPQTFSTVLKWKERKYKDQQMGTRTRLLQHNVRMDFQSQKQGYRLPFMTSRTPPKTPEESKQNRIYTDKYGQSSHH